MSLFGSGKPRKAKIEIVDPWDEVDEGEGDEEETDLDTMRQQVADWENAWMETPGYSALTEAQREDANSILDFFTDQMFNYHDASPEEWNVHAMEECCLETLPRKMSAEEDFFRAVSPVLGSFFTYLGETGLQRHGLEMAKHVGKLDRKIVAASNDPRYWGPAKSLAMAAMKQGVDLTDDRAMEAFVQQYNANIMGGSYPPDMFDDPEDPWDGGMDAGTFVREGPKVGRNDPCPCGSGKKYKKCCGSL